MKILALRLANLASLPGPLELDFSAPPLRDAGLFAITGPTGSGKSTLLDALCLALYGNTPRLRQAPGRDAPLPDVGEDTVSTADPRTLLRRGCASGYAEVDFIGRDGHHYRSRWAVRRARDKATGKLQAVEQSLHDLDNGQLLTTQKREFERLLPERLGLTFDQFTRAVLLAQSEFSAFLKADDNERSDLLERLTGTAEYSAISIAAYRRTSNAKKQVEALEAKISGDLPADTESRAELEDQASQAEEALHAVQQQAKLLDAQQQWHATDTRLHQAWMEGSQQHTAAEQRWQALADVRTDQRWRQQLAPQRHRLQRQKELPDLLSAQEEALTLTRQAWDAANAELKVSHAAYTQAEQTLVSASEHRQQVEPSLRKAREDTQALATLDHQLAELDRQVQERQREARQLGDQRRQTEQRHQQLNAQRDDLQASLEKLVGKHVSFDDARQAAQQQVDQTAQHGLALSELASAWQELQRIEQAHHELTQALATDEKRKNSLIEHGQRARQHLEQSETTYRQLSDFIEHSRAVRSESVARLRQHLRENEPCPVCGGMDHPWRHEPPETPEAKQLAAQQAHEDEQQAQARQAFDKAQQQRDELRGEYLALEKSLEQQRNDLEGTERRLAQARLSFRELPLHEALPDTDPLACRHWLEEQRKLYATQRHDAEQRLAQLTQAETELGPLEEALHQLQLALAQFNAQGNSLEQEQARLVHARPPLLQQRENISQRLATRLGEHASADAWQQYLEQQQDSARQARDKALSRHHQAQREQERLEARLQHETQRQDQLHQEKQQLEQELQQWRQAHPELDDSTLTRLLAQSQQEASHQDQELSVAEQTLQRTDASLAERRQALVQHRRAMTQVLAQGQAQEPTAQSDEDSNDSALLSEETQDGLQLHLKQVLAEQQALAPLLDSRQQQRDEAIHALRDDDRRRQRQQQAQSELESARAEHRRWGQINELIGSADGKAFRRIAQAYNLEQLLEHANLHLAGLSRRYRLIRGGSSLGLLVEDRDMGDERRSVHSLSGGETFLVSLALALGLASMASGELVIESLFIDEGFGSLDPQSLALAMEALDGLQALGRRVGVISHVQEMHERIPVQIIIEPLGNGTSRARLARS
ncbi:AAA family ATPase [Halomonas binhaiensis]|uniref:Nuclease SbcCD subunit C n=1 Tax=Halomonas binhaiensis TaxID=2562282 RepID=A0A5C1NFH5_9GAMM|nr:AAA family ATPase [Halomonas binhaiensis]QEM82482.1 AAA family ATPase [Halomonas binhaiensis]